MATVLLNALDVLAFIYLLLLFPIPIFWVVIHSRIHFWRRFGNQSFWIAVPAWVVTGILLVIARHAIFQTRIERNLFTWLLGTGLFLFAAWIERQTRREFGLRRLVGVPEMQPGHPLSGVVRTGIYARVRHPRYLEYMLTLVSLAFLTGAVGIFLLAIASVLLYQRVAALEERELQEHYGPQYEAYARAVPRFVPRLWRKTQPQIST